jgi:flagella basal body P-ring formation protein FlgA
MSVNSLTLLRRLQLRVLLLAALLAAPPGHAQSPEAGVQPLAAIRAAAERALRATIDASLPGVQLEAAALDVRLRLAACATRLDALATAPRHSQSRVPVRVSCAAPAWTVNVPVEIRRSHDVLVLRRAVGRGESITAADLNVQRRTLPGLASPFVSDAGQLAGRLTRRPLPEGTAVTADALSVALLIHRGQQVTLLAHANGFEVRAPGRAMADAAAHQRVRVQNLNSLKIVEGLADNDGVVRVLP